MENLMLGLSSLTPQRLLVVTALDVLLVAGLAAIVLLSGRMRNRALAAQRATLERLRAGLAELVSDAEQRAHELESALGAREERLRALLGEISRVENTARAVSRPAGGRPAKPAARADEVPPGATDELRPGRGSTAARAERSARRRRRPRAAARSPGAEAVTGKMLPRWEDNRRRAARGGSDGDAGPVASGLLSRMDPR